MTAPILDIAREVGASIYAHRTAPDAKSYGFTEASLTAFADRILAEERERPIEEILDHYADNGYCLALVYDDDGRWAVSDSGSSPIPDSDNGHTRMVMIASMVEPYQWRPTVREAVEAFCAANPLDAIHPHGEGGAPI